ncbi:MAG: hypothetical protein R3326_03045 [Gemmatimonadota bacterium]|nr:hypothetical protein [Gemmatimonadota bacterium]
MGRAAEPVPSGSPKRETSLFARRFVVAWGVALATACATDGTTAPGAVGEEPPVSGSAVAFPIDRGEDPAAPDTYKGLPLRLVDTGEPTVTSVDGVIGLVCVGMSNGHQECADFQARLEAGLVGGVNPAVRVVNCAVGGHAIERWIDPAEDAELWNRCVERRLPAAGVRLDQVRVVWHKAANQFTTGPDGQPLPSYPSTGSDYEAFYQNLTAFAVRVGEEFPAAQAVYTSSRSYGGYATRAARGEPLSYEEGHALNRWLADHPTFEGVWYGWGGYLWAPACLSGIVNGSGICYEREDYVADGIHPSPSGRAKVSRILHRRFGEHGWYRGR